MDAGKEIIFDERRQARAKEVGIQFVDGLYQHFNVITTKDEFDKKTGLLKLAAGTIKHMGILWGREPSIKDVCTCESFQFGNSDEFKKSHTHSFQCKHLHSARQIRFEGYPA